MIMDIASRALSFWSYQSNQETAYQQYLSRTLSHKYTSAQNQMETVRRDAHHEISSLSEKYAQMHESQSGLVQKNRDLGQLLNDRNKQCAKLKSLYDKLKQKAMLVPLQNAAEHRADHDLWQRQASDIPPSGSEFTFAATTPTHGRRPLATLSHNTTSITPVQITKQRYMR